MYCSASCVAADRLTAAPEHFERCDCGHPECHPDHVPTDQPPPEAQP
jgi:hypothetical protein